ncbi:MAG TPA: LuxR C-terminal-related transcriptional regulator [Thermomicrobiales bacterium]|nr:LuxR C-terminal-related transcriptional regulator [Thermomicrobiales bacterium]
MSSDELTTSLTPFMLPEPATTFVGRTDDIMTVMSMLARGDVRLLTLTGPGGIGKTRLAIETANLLQTVSSSIIRFLSFESVTDDTFLGRMIARALDVEIQRGTDVITQIQLALTERPVLLILNNLEHLPGASLTIAQVLAHCASITILATSRSPLEIRGEHLYPLKPLAVPSNDPQLAIEDLAKIDSIRLFIERAQTLSPAFRFTRENAAPIAAICGHLDGLPLAIELATAQIPALSPASILDHIQTRQPLPITGSIDTAARFRTIRNAIDWSYDLLSEDARRLFRRISIFPGSFSLHTVQSLNHNIGLGNDASSNDTEVTIRELSELIDHSLLRRDESADQPRYSMLQTIRRFGLDRLAASDEASLVSSTHAAIFLDFAERMRWAWVIASGNELDRLDAEHQNILAALGWFLKANDVHSLARMVVAMTGFWYVGVHDDTGTTWIIRALQCLPPPSRKLKGSLYISRGMLRGTQPDRSANEWLDEGIALLDEIDDAAEMTVALIWRGAIAHYRGDNDLAKTILDRALRAARKIDNTLLRAALQARAISNLGIAAGAEGHPERAAWYHDEARHLYRTHGFLPGLMQAFVDRGILACEQGNFSIAMIYFREGVSLSGTPADQALLMAVFDWCAVIAIEWKHITVAGRLLGASNALGQTLGEPWGNPLRDRVLSALQDSISPERIRKLLREGQNAPVEKAISAVRQLQLSTGTPNDEPILTARELEVLRLLADGLSNREIAEKLYLSVRTIESHVFHICRKLGARTRIAAVAIAVSKGLIDPDPN